MNRTVAVAIASALSLAFAAPALAEAPPPAGVATPQAASLPAADPADVGSPQAIVQATYATISGPAGKPRDWARFRSLMAPDARLIVAGVAANGSVFRRVLSVEDYVAHADPAFAKQGFYEHGVIPHAAVWAHVATVVSPYESRHAEGEQPFQRGINHFQLTSDGKRWFIESIMWEGETPAFPLPADAVAALNAR
jgi:hypothetical protein